MAKILVVDDSPFDRQLAVGLLAKRPGLTAIEKRTGLTTVQAGNGREAMDFIAREMPDLVLTDLQMPDMNGLELVQAIKREYPSLPVVLMTAHGSEDLAVQALNDGAASYVPKRNLAQDLLETIESILRAASAERDLERVHACVTELAASYVLDNDPSLVMPLVRHLEEPLKALKLCNGNGLLRVAVALQEALSNAIVHGNLEVGPSRLDKDDKALDRLADERRKQAPYRDRRVHIQANFTLRHATYVIRDEGPGFDVALLPDHRNPTALEKNDRRGLFLIRTFMDRVTYNDKGNQLTMVRNRD